jgi:hypothetical protein
MEHRLAEPRRCSREIWHSPVMTGFTVNRLTRISGPTDRLLCRCRHPPRGGPRQWRSGGVDDDEAERGQKKCPRRGAEDFQPAAKEQHQRT